LSDQYQEVVAEPGLKTFPPRKAISSPKNSTAINGRTAALLDYCERARRRAKAYRAVLGLSEADCSDSKPSTAFSIRRNLYRLETLNVESTRP
jgi:hypothetical protein